MDLDSIKFVGASDNYTRGRNGQKVAALVIHVMAGSQAGTRGWFNNPTSNVSAHFGISNGGDIDQYVSTNDTAWHSGSWDWNLKTVGIEHEGRPPGWSPTQAQLAASVELAVALCLRCGIEPGFGTILPHVQINPKHACPSSGFPLALYIKAVQDGVERARRPVQTERETSHVSTLEYALYDPSTNKQVGTASVIKGTDKAYIKTLSRTVVRRAGRATAESYGRVRLFDASNVQVGTLSLVLSGPRKAYINDLPLDLLPR